MAHGFVYVLGNPSMPCIFKIGFTLKHPKERMAELSRATACPTPFELLAFIGIEEPQEVEREIHRTLSDFRVNDAREFFRADPWWIQDLLRQYGNPDEDAFFDSALDLVVAEYHWAKERQYLKNLFFEQSADPIDWTPRGFD